MLLVKSVEIIKVRDDIETILYHYDPDPYILTGDGKVEEKIVIRELIRGEIFTNHRGEKLVIGWSNNVQEALGMPFHAFSTMNTEVSHQKDTIRYLDSENKYLKSEIQSIKSMKFLGRLKALLFGYKKEQKNV